MKKDRIVCIYCMENKINNKKYIGQTRDYNRRVKHHLKYYKTKDNDYLRRSIEKYGIKSFEIYILEECLIEELNEKEEYYIDFYKTTQRDFGYNILKGGETPPNFSGKNHSEETKRKMSEKAKGNKHWLGKHHSEETKKIKSELASSTNHYFFGKKRANSSSSYYGVSRHIDKRSGLKTWRAKISLFGKVISIGSSKDEIIAAKMYDDFVMKNNLPNPLNFKNDF